MEGLGPGFEPGTSGSTARPSQSDVFQNYDSITSFAPSYAEKRDGKCLEITVILLEIFNSDLAKDGVSEKTRHDWLNYLKKAIGKKLCDAEDVRRLWTNGSQRKWKESLSRFFSWYERKYEADELIAKLRKGLPEKVKRGVDTYVPTDAEILKLRDSLPSQYADVYNVLICTGLRMTEVLYLLNNKDKLRVVDLGEFVRIHLDLMRKSKNALVCYLPKAVFQSLKPLKVHEDTVQKAFCESGLCEKYLRKWFNQKVRQTVKDRDLAEFLEGRISGLSVGAVHYTDLIALADKEYPRVFEVIKPFTKME
ncbi:integrase [Saccharolobus islandicus]|uniref:integrase n=1 Tax=Saccharolobus islandicus TaxID=43080 RepID=UPI00036FFDF2|nr:integrase [Sulfolobus islandicus]